ncbi:hypothetical protein [Persicobacter psychrovividus]|uniref:Uncharacterized protein n=1 Tax=Persicobacter psychrovividus TaxID=387638 RepID=A0ABM7VF18_9BACT|nr:hypothetical protein PEPS_15480 [Persicobacter psychrovividus]
MRALKLFIVACLTVIGSTAMAHNNNTASSSSVVVAFNKSSKTLEIAKAGEINENMNTVIDLNQIDNLNYKAKVYRYFGGIVRHNAMGFETIKINDGANTNEVVFNKENLAEIINSLMK